MFFLINSTFRVHYKIMIRNDSFCIRMYVHINLLYFVAFYYLNELGILCKTKNKKTKKNIKPKVGAYNGNINWVSTNASAVHI